MVARIPNVPLMHLGRVYDRRTHDRDRVLRWSTASSGTCPKRSAPGLQGFEQAVGEVADDGGSTMTSIRKVQVMVSTDMYSPAAIRSLMAASCRTA